MQKMEIELSHTTVSDDKSERSSSESSTSKSYLDNDDSMLVSDIDSDNNNNNENNDNDNKIEDSKTDMEREGSWLKLLQVLPNQMIDQFDPSQNNGWQKIKNDLFSSLNHSWLANFNGQTDFYMD